MFTHYTTSVDQIGVTLTAEVIVIGRDLAITVTGGDHPHIGDVTTLTHAQAIQTIRYPSHDGRFHKDDMLAIPLAKALQPFLPGSCTIMAGFHVDHITKAQIQAALSLSTTLAAKIVAWLQDQHFHETDPQYYGKNERPE